MGIQLSILIGYIGALELLSYLRHICIGVLRFLDSEEVHLAEQEITAADGQHQDVYINNSKSHSKPDIHLESLINKESDNIQDNSQLSDFNEETHNNEKEITKCNVLTSLTIPKADEYVRVPTPISFYLDDEPFNSGSVSDVDQSSIDDSGNEAPTKNSIDSHNLCITRYDGSSSDLCSEDSPRCVSDGSSKQHKSKSLGVRKHKSSTEFGRSLSENFIQRKSKRHRDLERCTSDVSPHLRKRLLKDEGTNTSPTNSVVQLNPECRSDNIGPKSFGLSCAEEKQCSKCNCTENCNNCKVIKEVSKRGKQHPVRISSFEEASEDDYEKIKNIIFDPKNKDRKKAARDWKTDDSHLKTSIDSESLDEYVDAEDTIRGGPIQYSIPDVGDNQAFWLIFSGEYTKAMNKDWHSGHFCCWQCDESLTGQRYVLRDEHPYCIKCYESVFANGCEECSKIIGIDSKDLSYKDKHWHEACFLCNKCRVSLVDKQFGSKVDKIYCGNCYDSQFASRCDGCGEIFRAGTKKMEYKTRQWHEKCFCCCVCKNPIGTKSFIPREQEIYCAGCYEDKFATRCVKCNKIITSGGVTYKNEPWHRDCFTCSHCNNSLAGQRFTSRDDKPYCADCFGELFAKRCTACSKPITGIGGTRFISFEDRHWHNDCFICAGCNTSLVGRGFITDAEDIICPECAKQKLS